MGREDRRHRGSPRRYCFPDDRNQPGKGRDSVSFEGEMWRESGEFGGWGGVGPWGGHSRLTVIEVTEAALQ